MARRRPTAATPLPRPASAAATTLGLFALALALRLLFWQATPDRALPYGALFKGDAATWLEGAAALRSGAPFELGLPLRPPGTTWLVAALWDGSARGVPGLRAAWAALGAAAVALLYLACRRTLGARVAGVAGLLFAGSSALLLLAGTVDGETPYLVLVAASFCLWPEVAAGHRRALLGWGALHGIACLFRVEHALAAALLGAWLLAAGWSGVAAGERLRRGVLAAAAWLAVLAPWHLHAWRAIAEFNDGGERSADAAADAAIAAVERGVAHLPWDAGALAERQRLPAAVRRTAGAFVAATVQVRGGSRVDAGSFRALDEAFGWRPRALPRRPFVALYGPLNFYLGNHPSGRAGFTTAPLAAPPPLAGGCAAYPSQLVGGLPPPGLALTYPPHLRLVVEGYRLGWEQIRESPAAWLALAGRKLAWFWEGASLGLGGLGAPVGLSGLRRSVDLATRQGVWAATWRLLVLGAVAAALWMQRRRRELVPWLLYAASKVAVTIAFFGYARQGALVAPVVLLVLALPLAERLPAAPRATRRLAPAAVVALLVAEALRWLAQPGVSVDGRAVRGGEPFSFEDHRPRQVEVVWR